MLANSREPGLELLNQMAEAAARRAALQLCPPFQLTQCMMVELRPGLASAELKLESWAVRTDGRAVTISVFATAIRPEGPNRMAGTGRFTFSPLPTDRKDFPS